MDLNIGRLKKWDYGVAIAFLVNIFGVSFIWWRDKVASALESAMDELSEALGELPGGSAVPLEVPGYDTVNILGWDMGAGRAAFIFALFAVLFVAAKILVSADKPLPKWYMESYVVLLFGGIVTLCGLIGTLDAPFGGYDVWAWWPGGLFTLVSGLGVLYCGYMMLKDKSGDYGVSTMPKINVNTGSSTPPSDPPPTA